MTIHSACAPSEQLLAGSSARRATGRLALVAPPDDRPRGTYVPPDDPFEPPDYAYDLLDVGDPEASALLSEEQYYDSDLPPMSAVDQLEWELWASADQDEAERFMLRQEAPDWVFLPPGGALAAALEPVRPQCLSPMAAIEFIKAASRLASWAEALKAGAMASFFRQRKAQEAETPRPEEIDSSGRPVDPERSWAAEIGAALHLSTNTAARHIETALHLSGPVAATLTALRTGALTWSKALAISEATRGLSDEDAKSVEAHVLKRAASQTNANLRKSLRTQVAKHQAATEADRHREAVRERTCKIVPLPDGMAGLWVVHTADRIQQMWVAISAIADLAKRPTAASQATAETPGQPDAAPPVRTPAANPSAATPEQSGSGSPAASSAAASIAIPESPVPVSPDAFPAASSGNPAAPVAVPASPGAFPAAPAAVPARLGAVPASPIADLASPGAASATPGAAPAAPAFVAACPGADPGSPIADPAAPAFAATSRVAPGQSAPATPAEPTTPADGHDPSSGLPTNANFAESAAEPDQRNAEQRRADVMADLFGHIIHNGLDWLGRRLPDQHRRRPHIEVLIPVGTALGLDNEPCELTGYGPIPAELARRIAEDGTWRRLLTDPTNGVVLEASTTRHDPSTLVTETLLARHPVCAWPGCNRSSRECDRDHGTPFAVTGRTSLAGLAPYCEYHHVIKDTPRWDWKTENHPDGSVTLVAPTGHRYTTVPPARGPITRQPATPPRYDAPPVRTDTRASHSRSPETVPANPSPPSDGAPQNRLPGRSLRGDLGSSWSARPLGDSPPF